MTQGTTNQQSLAATMRKGKKQPPVYFYALVLVLLAFSFQNILYAGDVSCTHQLQSENMMINPSVMAQLDTNSSSAIDHHHDWCPNAVCYDSILCKPCQRRYLVVIASGRSASTSLTWMLDQLPGVRMSGENYDVLRHMHIAIKETYIKIGKNPIRPGAMGRNPIFNGSHACATQQLIEAITPPMISNNFDIEKESEMIIGFKTLKLGNTTEELEDRIQFLKESLPCSKIVVNIRSDTFAQAKSQKQAFLEDGQTHKMTKRKIEKDILHQNFLLKEIVNIFDNPNQAILLDSSQWTKNITILNEVVTWLGFHPSCQFKELLEYNTKNLWGGYGHSKIELQHKMDQNCQYIGQ